jgi:hypothetical protein
MFFFPSCVFLYLLHVASFRHKLPATLALATEVKMVNAASMKVIQTR